uniref:RNA helicase n=1 Tax=Alexandrium catenella TaxID=2925 RepID=A0A7S1RHE8_ALECA
MARTGSGKTAAFIIPIVERLGSHSVSVGIRAVVLSPTRELAMQTAKFFRQLSRHSGLRCCLLVGGQAMEKQFEHLANNPDIVIATPGRLMHHMLEAELSLTRIEILVFDEADRLFELGFAEQLQQVLEKTPTSRQCLLFSATLPAQLVSFSRSGVKNPVFVRLDVETTISDALDLWYLYVRKDEKLAATVAVLRHLHRQEKSTIMFVATRHHVEFFGEFLAQFGLPAAIVYGSMDQVARLEQVARFRKGKARILVTTDVAARGIDIPFLDHVLNFDFPPSAKLFVHRSGRTARAGRSGICASLVTLDDLPYATELMLFLGHKIALPDGSSSTSGTSEDGKRVPVIGAVPGLEHEMEKIEAVLKEEGTVLHGLHKSMMASYNIYNKTRPTASKQSAARAKQMLEDCGGAGRLQSLCHPAFRDVADETQGHAASGVVVSKAGAALIQELRGFRPRVEKVGNVISTGSMRTMEQAKLDASAVAATRLAEGSSEFLSMPEPAGGTPAPPEPPPSRPEVRDRARMSKRQRRELSRGGGGAAGAGGAAGGAGAFDGWDVQVDGQTLGGEETPATGSRARGKPAVEQFYLSTARNSSVTAKERGLEMEQYQMDLLPDDSTDIQRAKSVIRWDAKKKKYLPVMVSVDGRIVKQGKKVNESGHRVRGEREKSDLYKKWAKSTKRRIQKVGEMEQESGGPFGGIKHQAQGRTIEFGAGGEEVEGAKTRKPVVPFHGEIEEKYLTHKQKRIMKKRSGADSVAGKGQVASEMKTPSQIQKEKKQRDRLKLKQNPKLRKKADKEWKTNHKQKMEERSMKYGARTRSKMLIIEGSKRKGGRGTRPMTGHGPMSSV